MPVIVCVLCMSVDDTRDKVKHLSDGGTVSRETTCGESLTDFLFFLVLDNIIRLVTPQNLAVAYLSSPIVQYNTIQ